MSKEIELTQQTDIKRFLVDVMPGLIAGLFAVIYCISFAALIFSGNLSSYLPIGIGLMLLTAIIVSSIVSIFSSFPCTIAGPQDTTAAILSLVATNIVTLMPGASRQETFLTMIATIIVSSVVSGLVFLGLGWFNLGKFIRFIPYPVIGGFMAGSGWLLFRGALKLMTGISLDLTKLHQQIPVLLAPELLIQWIPGLIFALILTIVLPRFRHFLVMPGLLIGAFILFYVVTSLLGIDKTMASQFGLLLGPFPKGSSLQFLTFTAATRAAWPIVFSQFGSIGALCLINTIALLLNASAIELVAKKDIDLNQELKVVGMSTIISSFFGGFGGFHSVSRSSLVYRLGARHRLVGWIVASVCLIMLLVGPSVLSAVPKSLVGGMLLYLGLEFLIEWVYRAWFKLARGDYFIVLLILLIVAFIGYLEGVAIGTLAATVLFAVTCSQIDVTKRTLSGSNYHSNVLRTPEQEKQLREQGDQIHIIELQGLLFFGTANKLLNSIRERIDNPNRQPVRFILLGFRLCTGLDASAVVSFVKLQQIASQKDIVVVFANLTPEYQQRLQQGGCLAPDDEFCRDFPDLDRALEWCEQQILTAQTEESKVLTLSQQLEPLFHSYEFVSELMQYLTPLSLDTNEYLFRQGDDFNGLYFVEQGRVSVVLELEEGKSKRIRSYTGGNTIGEMGLYRQAPRMASVVADEPTSLYFLSTDAFESMQVDKPLVAASFHRFIVNLLAERLIHREQELKTLLQ